MHLIGSICKESDRIRMHYQSNDSYTLDFLDNTIGILEAQRDAGLDVH